MPGTNKHLIKKDLDIDEKKVMGRIIDMWSLGDQEHPYMFSTESEIIKYSKNDGLSEDKILNILKDLEDRKLIRRIEENGKIFVKYRAEASHIVKELQKTSYVHSRERFKPPNH
jgi:hypothetical protein